MKQMAIIIAYLETKNFDVSNSARHSGVSPVMRTKYKDSQTNQGVFGYPFTYFGFEERIYIIHVSECR
jgi:hypothetical protein